MHSWIYLVVCFGLVAFAAARSQGQNAEDLAAELEALENAVRARGLAEDETEDGEEERGLDKLTPQEILDLIQSGELDPQSVFGGSEGAARRGLEGDEAKRVIPCIPGLPGSCSLPRWRWRWRKPRWRWGKK